MNYDELQDDPVEEQIDPPAPVIEKLSLSDRIAKDKAARQRRKQTKQAVDAHSYKEEKDARERLIAKRRLAKQKKNSKRR